MRSDTVEAWTEVNLVPVEMMDHALLVEVVDPLVHGALADEIATWFYLWEPELRLRIRWREPARSPEHRRTLAAELDRLRETGLFTDWYEGAHGAQGETYVGEADHYGEEIWPLVQRDWMNGSELALATIKLERAGLLTRSREYHWKRHVHLFTNQLHGTWEAEIELCLAQALGYSRLRAAPPEPESAKLIAELNDFLDG
jgi:hypothetical protein